MSQVSSSFNKKKTIKSYFIWIIVLVITLSSLTSTVITQDGNIVKTDNHFNGSLEPTIISFEDPIQVSNTGWNSTQTRVVYNPNTEGVYISWIDLYQPYTQNAESSVYYAFGNSSENWIDNTQLVTSINGTATLGYNPSYDADNTIHLVYDEFSSTNFEINDTTLTNELTLQPEINIVSNSGNSTNPVTITDNNGLIHLVWIDKTANPLGDLYYTHYNSTTGSWNSTFTLITSGAQVNAASKPAIAIDENNTIHAVWADSRTADQELYYSYKEKDAQWSTEEKITNVAYNPINPELSYDEQSKELHLLFKDNDSSTNLYYMKAAAKAIASGWSLPTVVSSNLPLTGDYDIISDGFGSTLLVFERNDGLRNNIYLRQRNSNSSTWGDLILISSLAIKAYDPAITIDQDGLIYITYTQITNGKTEVYIRYGILDSDGDGITDQDEINTYNTDPFSADSDNDNVDDGDEILIYSTDPNDSDSDDDLMPDGYEIQNSLNPNNPSDATQDPDSDDLTNLEEYNEGTLPFQNDTDTDSVLDGAEVNTYFTDPLDPDTDSDTLLDGYEIKYDLDPLVADDITTDEDGDGLDLEYESYIWTDPKNADTDGDGFSDGIEVSKGTDPLDPLDFPDLSGSRDYTNVVIGILSTMGVIVVGLSITYLIARQFKPKESDKRKELERDEQKFLESTGKQKEKPKPKQLTFEEIKELSKEQEAEVKETESTTAADKEPLEQPDTEQIPEEIKEPKEEEMKLVEADQTLQQREISMKQAIEFLNQHEIKLKEILDNELTAENLNQATKEILVKYAKMAQKQYTEAKETWSKTILPLIKGFEVELYSTTLEAERVIDNCKKIYDVIIDILVKIEIQILEGGKDEEKEEIDNEEKKTQVRERAMKAIGLEEEDPPEPQEKDE